MLATILLIHVASTLMLTGLIWFVQLVHYPLYGLVGPERFIAYEQQHTQGITPLVAPLMLAELGTALWLVFVQRPGAVPAWMTWAGLALVSLLWASTFLLQVPQHEVLLRGYDERAHRLLVVTNWLRTVAWTARGALVLGMVWLVTRIE